MSNFKRIPFAMVDTQIENINNMNAKPNGRKYTRRTHVGRHTFGYEYKGEFISLSPPLSINQMHTYAEAFRDAMYQADDANKDKARKEILDKIVPSMPPITIQRRY